MKNIKKIITSEMFIIISCLTFTISASASGFIFQWEPLAVDNNLVLNHSGKDVFINNFTFHDFNIPVSDDSLNKFVLSEGQDSLSIQKKGKKVMPENIKINFSSTLILETDKYPIYFTSEDKQISEFVNALTSLIYDDSKSKSLETIGKIIEPQIQFYFEF
jgi:hypothetical protein